MKNTEVYADKGYVLHMRPYRETSLLVDIFTENYGRIHVVARGVRKNIGKKALFLQLFTRYHFSWQGRTELYNLRSAENQGASYLFSPYQLCCGLYLNELLTRVLAKEDVHSDIYTDYAASLNNFSQSDDNNEKLQIVLRTFEKNLLQNLGYGFPLTEDYSTREKVEENAYYIFEPQRGLIYSPVKTPHTFSGESLIAFNENRLESYHLKEIKRLMRLSLALIIGERPLKSRELFV